MAAKTPNPAVGSRYGRLTVTGEASPRGRNLVVPVSCECGLAREVLKSNLVTGKSQSCGCLNVELLTQRSRKYPVGTRSTYSIWHAMWDRCTREGNAHFHNYGGRGIKVCSRWKRFENFLKDMGVAPKGMTLERRVNDKGYSKSNCAWVTSAANQMNKRTYRRVSYRRQEYTILKLSRIAAIPWRVLYDRIFVQGLSVEAAVRKEEI